MTTPEGDSDSGRSDRTAGTAENSVNSLTGYEADDELSREDELSWELSDDSGTRGGHRREPAEYDSRSTEGLDEVDPPALDGRDSGEYPPPNESVNSLTGYEADDELSRELSDDSATRGGGHEQEKSWDSQYDEFFLGRSNSGEYRPANQEERIEELAENAGLGTAPKDEKIDDAKMKAFMEAREARKPQFNEVIQQNLANAEQAARARQEKEERWKAKEQEIRDRQGTEKQNEQGKEMGI
jgi:hypothetical protein